MSLLLYSFFAELTKPSFIKSRAKNNRLTSETWISEYAYTSKVNRKTDVYSFGVVLLELTTGREAVTYGDHMNLAARAHLHYRDTNAIIDAVDDEIRETIYMDQIITVFRLGVICTATSPSNRPFMKDCLHILQNCTRDSS